jgi:cell division protein FtsW (lipid II flippase)
MEDRKPVHDGWILGLAALASIFGLIALYSVGLGQSDELWWGIPKEPLKQTFLLLGGLVLFGAARVCPPHILRLGLVAGFIVSLVGVALTFTSLGVTINSQRLWLRVGEAFTIQPSEFLKGTTILLVGLLLAERGPRPELKRLPRDMGEWIGAFLIPRTAHLFPMLLAGAAILAIVAQKDIGTAGVVFVSALAMYFVGGAPTRVMWGIFAGLVVAAMIFPLVGGYRAGRFDSWWNRWEKKTSGGFQQALSEAALARGGALGKGLANGRVKETQSVATSDFVLTTIGEETGLVGTLIVLGTLAALSLLLLVRSALPEDPARLAWAGMGVWIASQTVVNYCMANASLPAIGLPLPFISQGGSNLLAIWISLGAIMALSMSHALATRKRNESSSHRRGNGRTRLSGA